MPPQVEEIKLTTADAGKARLHPSTFLEQWGSEFLAVAGVWVLLVCSAILVYFLCHLPAPPNLAGLTAEQAKDALSVYKQLVDQWRDSLVSIFDLLVTKTSLPIVTLLIGYLFAKKTS